jgi:hypothetical protein
MKTWFIVGLAILVCADCIDPATHPGRIELAENVRFASSWSETQWAKVIPKADSSKKSSFSRSRMLRRRKTISSAPQISSWLPG